MRIALRGHREGNHRHRQALVAQAEAVVGFLNAYELSGADYFLKASQNSWEFIENTSWIANAESGIGKCRATERPATTSAKWIPGNVRITTAGLL